MNAERKHLLHLLASYHDSNVAVNRGYDGCGQVIYFIYPQFEKTHSHIYSRLRNEFSIEEFENEGEKYKVLMTEEYDESAMGYTGY